MSDNKTLVRKGRCKPRWRLRTPEELGVTDPEPWHVLHAGKTAVTLRQLTGWYGNAVTVQFEGEEESVEMQADWMERYVPHQWLDTGGMLRSYCSHCDARGLWSHEHQEYQPMDPEPEEPMVTPATQSSSSSWAQQVWGGNIVYTSNPAAGTLTPSGFSFVVPGSGKP